METKLTFEEKIARIEEIVELLDEGRLPLNDLIELYEEAMRLSVDCKSFLEKAELKIEEINKGFSKETELNSEEIEEF